MFRQVELRHRRSTSGAAGLAALLAVLVTNGAFGDVISPGIASASEGNILNHYPFDVGPGQSARFEQLYIASDFGSSPLTITGIAFRPDVTSGAGAPFSTTLSSVTIKLSTTSAGLP